MEARAKAAKGCLFDPQDIACKDLSDNDDDQAPSVAVAKRLLIMLCFVSLQIGHGLCGCRISSGPGELAEPGEGEGEREPAAGRTARIV